MNRIEANIIYSILNEIMFCFVLIIAFVLLKVVCITFLRNVGGGVGYLMHCSALFRGRGGQKQ